MPILFFDAFSGVSGDMILGSLIDLGVNFNWLNKELAKLPLINYSLNHEIKSVNGIHSVKFNVSLKQEHHHRNLSDILKIINDSTLEPSVKTKATEIFNLLACAEAKVHNTTIDKIHFHEVGAVDSIIDIVGSVIAINSLDVNEVISSPLPMGRGFVNCDHGKLPLPAPATLEILKDFPVYGVDEQGELVTPTGAAIIKSFTNTVSNFPKMTINKIGYGSGSATRKTPNLLRVIVGEKSLDDTIKKKLILIETNIDDLNLEIFPYITEKLFDIGALDCYTAPIAMKKGRQGIKLSVLLEPHLETKVTDILFTETSTLGIRKINIKREELSRKNVMFNSSFGLIKIKESFLNGNRVNFKPEYEELNHIASVTNIPLKNIRDKIISEYLSSAVTQSDF